MEQPRTEAELAAYYEAHRDDPNEWEELPSPSPLKRSRGRPSRGFRATITVRFTEAEAELIRREASRTESTYSEVVRRAVTTALSGDSSAA